MQQKYYVNDNPQSTSGDHEVHVETCSFFPKYNKTYLGEFETCFPAVREAMKYHIKVNGCKHCCEPCHTS